MAFLIGCDRWRLDLEFDGEEMVLSLFGAILDYLDDFWLCWRRWGWHLCKKCISCYIYNIIIYGMPWHLNWLREVKFGFWDWWWYDGLLGHYWGHFLMTLMIFDCWGRWEVTSGRQCFSCYIYNLVTYVMTWSLDRLWEVKGLVVVWWCFGLQLEPFFWYFDGCLC